MPYTLSFYFLGTDCHRSRYADALTNFYEATERAAQKGHSVVARLFDGVGSKPTTNMANEHPTPGRYVYNPLTRQKTQGGNVVSEKVDDLMQQFRGCVAGAGMDHLLLEAAQFLASEIEKNDGQMPESVNLYGFSRGADACVRLANLLASSYPELKINLFLVDPVPGPGRANDSDSYTVPKNVKKFEVALMLHENTPGFEPQNNYVFTNPATEVAIKVYPGKHGQALLLTEDDNVNQVPKLLHDDLFKFARETGSLPDSSTPPPYLIKKQGDNWIDHRREKAFELTKRARFDLYNDIQKTWWIYSKGTEINKREILTHYEKYSLNPSVFVNQEHSELFKALYPKIYDWYFNNNSNKKEEKEVREELGKLAREAPEFYGRFCANYRTSKEKSLPLPGQAPIIFRRPLGSSLVEDNKRSFVEHLINTIINNKKQHKKEGKKHSKTAVRFLQICLNQAAKKQNDAQAISYLEEKVSKALKYLEKTGRKSSYMYRQLSKLAYFERLDKLLKEHIEKNHELHPSQKERLQELKKELWEISTDQGDYMQNLRKAQEKICDVISELEHPKTELGPNANNINYNQSAAAFYRLSPTKGPNLDDLVKNLKASNTLGFAETTIASEIARHFKAYNKRNSLLEGMASILSLVTGIKPPAFFSKEKSALAQDMHRELIKLNQSGQGNDVNKINQILSQGQSKLREIYKESVFSGEFDKVLTKSRSYIDMEGEAPLSDEKKQLLAPEPLHPL